MTNQLPAPARHRYHARPTADGFILDGGAERQPVRITLSSTHWLVEPEGRSEEKQSRRFGLFEVHPLIATAAHWSMCSWRPRPSPAPEWRLYQWAAKQASRSIAWVVGQQRELLMSRVEPSIRDVQRALFTACCTAGELALREEFYQQADRFLLQDILRYRAAAVAVRHFGEKLLEESYRDYSRDCFDDMPEPFIDRACRRLRSWRELFSDTGSSYGALNRTLDQLPGGISHHLAAFFPATYLLRQIVNRLELAVLLLSLGGHQHPNGRVFQFAERHEILRALQRVGRALHRELSPRRTQDLRIFVRYLCDYPEAHSGNIVGLAERSAQWHRNLARQQANEIIGQAGDDCAVVLPPVPLPEVPGLTFLRTVGSIRLEGILMGHCISNYVPNALDGRCFLFHYEEAGMMASVEVSHDGHVQQSFGPYNTRNRVARKAARLLGEWGRTFPPAAPPLPIGIYKNEILV